LLYQVSLLLFISLLKLLMRNYIFSHHIQEIIDAKWTHELEIFADHFQGGIKSILGVEVLLKSTMLFF